MPGVAKSVGNYITIRDFDADIIEATEKVKVLDAVERTKAIELVGNALDNTIYSGTGNDTLTGNDGSDIIFNTAKGSLTLKNARGKTLNLIDSAGETVSTIIGGGSPAQAIKNLTGIDVDNLEKIPVTNDNELDALKNADMSVLEVSDNQNVDLREFVNPQIVSLVGGRQTVQFNDRDYNFAIVDENASGYKNIVFGTGKDLGIPTPITLPTRLRTIQFNSATAKSALITVPPSNSNSKTMVFCRLQTTLNCNSTESA